MKGKRPAAPEDTVFFSLHTPIPDEAHAEETLNSLRLDCLAVALPLCDGYIWQHDNFNLSLHFNTVGDAPQAFPACPCRCPPELSDADPGEQRLAVSPTPLPPHLHGKLKYGDNIDDEWFVVFLLYSISRHVPRVCVRVWDSDGEFLLIEAAYSIPRWLKPENSWNRVFIRNGEVHILPLPSSPAELVQLPLVPSIQDALRVFFDTSIKTKAHDSVQQATLRKVSGFQQNPTQNMHNVVCRLPLSIAKVLKHEPQLVALAVAAFYNRDVDSMKAASQLKYFLMDGMDTQFVDVRVRMSRAMYAQLKQQVFQAPRCYPMPKLSDSHFAEAELGMKLTCGFEMMHWECSTYGTKDKSTIANTRGSKDVGWQAFLASLQQTGYFKDLLEGSSGYRELMEKALSSYQNTNLSSRVSAAIKAPIERINEILALPFSAEDFLNSEEMKSDDESWLYNGENELNNVILERQRELEMYEHERSMRKGKRTQNLPKDKASNSNLKGEDVVKSVRSFIEKVSSYEGAELPAERDNDELITLKMETFMEELKSAFGLEMENNQNGSDDEMDTLLSDSDSDVETVERGWSTNGELQNASLEDNMFMEEYGEVLGRELTSSSLAKSFVMEDKNLSSADTSKGTDEEMEVLPPVNIDVNLLKNILDSYSLQHGLPGPASNLLGAMGLNLPENKDED